MKYYIIAGEASGDLHGSNLVKELLLLDAQAHIHAWGGDKMEQAGATLVKHYRSLAFMGFIEVIKNLRTILANLSFCKKDITDFRPDVIVLIDYPGFNLRIAKWAKEYGYRVVYYISPQVWAWKEGRVKGIKKWVDEMLVILPFEKEFYKKWHYAVEYVGHPLVKVISEAKSQHEKDSLHCVGLNSDNDLQQISPEFDNPVVALLPGSRKQEISVKLPVMLQAAKQFAGYQFIIAQAPGIEIDFYKNMIAATDNAVIAMAGQSYVLLSQAKAALVTSGTATLETALFEVPQVVCYKGSAISYQIAKRLVKIKYISLVNLIMDKPVVKELIQAEMNVTNIVKELHALLHNMEYTNRIKNDYRQLRTLLQKDGDASAKAAKKIFDFATSAPAL